MFFISQGDRSGKNQHLGINNRKSGKMSHRACRAPHPNGYHSVTWQGRRYMGPSWVGGMGAPHASSKGTITDAAPVVVFTTSHCRR